MKLIRLVGLAVLFITALAWPVAAQTKPVNPRTIEVNPDPDSYALVVRLEVAYFIPGAAQPVSGPVSIGKPPITATGCSAPLVDPCARTSINTMALPFGFDYVGKVWAVGLNGATEIFSEWSPVSNPFDRKPGAPVYVVIK